MLTAAAALPAKLDQNNGHPIGMGVAFFGICAFMVILFLLIVWVGKLRDKRRGPREAPQLPLLVKDDERRERRRSGQ
ncbi:hypothetical protein HJ588_01740 [Flexivirga sp. ID2601S]|uniref:Uncharacterized protein n=1 Tax=Flexivirga aerilata TaxID=1656889 RepID=A0A849ABY8_9MICO|nr:hypothetical protein [Flexivirga aerilata]NNG37999.1 hypothetical protein [Flexivirga aerilata]